MAVVSLVIIYLPASYNSEIRKVGISQEKSIAIKDEFSRVILDMSSYFKEKKGDIK